MTEEESLDNLTEEEVERLERLIADSQEDLKDAIKLAMTEGTSTYKEVINEIFPFHMGSQEVKLHIHEIEILKKDDKVLSFKIKARGDFKQVLKLARELNIRLNAFKKSFKIELRARKEMISAIHDFLILEPTVEELMGILDGHFKRPVFLNMYLYHVDRIFQ